MTLYPNTSMVCVVISGLFLSYNRVYLTGWGIFSFSYSLESMKWFIWVVKKNLHLPGGIMNVDVYELDLDKFHDLYLSNSKWTKTGSSNLMSCLNLFVKLDVTWWRALFLSLSSNRHYLLSSIVSSGDPAHLIVTGNHLSPIQLPDMFFLLKLTNAIDLCVFSIWNSTNDSFLLVYLHTFPSKSKQIPFPARCNPIRVWLFLRLVNIISWLVSFIPFWLKSRCYMDLLSAKLSLNILTALSLYPILFQDRSINLRLLNLFKSVNNWTKSSPLK